MGELSTKMAANNNEGTDPGIRGARPRGELHFCRVFAKLFEDIRREMWNLRQRWTGDGNGSFHGAGDSEGAAFYKGAECSEARKMPKEPILQALRVQHAFLARPRSISRENIMRFSRETNAFLARNGSNSRENCDCFSREMEVILARNGSSSRQTAIDISKDK